MNMKRRLASFVAFFIVLVCLSAYPAAGLADGEESMMSQVNAEKTVGAFDFESKTVLLNSGYTMPIMGLGTYALDHDTCVNSVMSLLESGGRLIDTAYMYGNEEAVGEGVRKGMEEYGIPREDIFVITKIYPNQFNDPEAAIDMALEKLDIGYIDMMLLHHPGTNDVMAYQAMEQYVEEGKIHSLGLSNWYVEELTEFLPKVGWSGADNTIVCAAGHHFREGRWLRDPQYLADNARFWLAGKDASHRWGYSSWLYTGTCQLAEVSGLDDLPAALLDDAVNYYARWEKGVPKQGGKFIMGGDGKGGFMSLDGHEGTEISLGGSGWKPLFNSAMWSEAKSIAAVARRVGKADLAAQFEAKAEGVRKALMAQCWNGDLKFFTTRHRDGALTAVRELHGYAPWYFGMPLDVAPDWEQLFDEKGFAAQYGLTFPERRAKGFTIAYKGHECQWNGPSWPFATSVALTAYINGLHSRARKPGERERFTFLMWQYAFAHKLHRTPTNPVGRRFDPTVPWIDENMNPDTADWIARTLLLQRKQKPRERGKDYNHSTFCDLVISGLVGFMPEGADGFSVDPLCPATWDYFILDNLRYRGHDVSIRWHRGRGLTVKVDGREAAHSPTLSKVHVCLVP